MREPSIGISLEDLENKAEESRLQLIQFLAELGQSWEAAQRSGDPEEVASITATLHRVATAFDDIYRLTGVTLQDILVGPHGRVPSGS